MNSVDDRESLRMTSKRLFGNSYMLEVCVAIARGDDRVCLTQLAAANEVGSPSLYSAPLKRLASLGLLHPDSRTSDNHRERWYARSESALWSAVLEFAA